MHCTMNPNQVKSEEHHDTSEKECKGIPLMEVFGLLYLGHAPVTAENQSGTITIVSNRGKQYLYEVPEEEIEDVDLTKATLMYKDDIPVSVKAPTCCFTKLFMNFDLFSGRYKGDIKVNVDWGFIKRCNGQVLCMEKRIISRDCTGEIAVRMGFFANATVARFNITLADQAAGTDAYGIVVASNSKLDYAPKFASVLFVRKESDSVQLGDNGVIPLSKSLVGVPLDSFLHVDICLIINGVHFPASVKFKADTAGKTTDIVRGTPIKVTVDWDAKEDSETAELKTIFNAGQQSEFETLYGPYEDVTDDSDNY